MENGKRLTRRSFLFGSAAALTVFSATKAMAAPIAPPPPTVVPKGASDSQANKLKEAFDVEVVKKVENREATDGTRVTLVTMDTEVPYLPRQEEIVKIINELSDIGQQADAVVLDSDSEKLIQNMSKKAGIDANLGKTLTLPGEQIHRGSLNALFVPSPDISINTGAKWTILGSAITGAIFAKSINDPYSRDDFIRLSYAFFITVSLSATMATAEIRNSLNDADVMLNEAIKRAKESGAEKPKRVLIVISEKNI